MVILACTISDHVCGLFAPRRILNLILNLVFTFSRIRFIVYLLTLVINYVYCTRYIHTLVRCHILASTLKFSTCTEINTLGWIRYRGTLVSMSHIGFHTKIDTLIRAYFDAGLDHFNSNPSFGRHSYPRGCFLCGTFPSCYIYWASS